MEPFHQLRFNGNQIPDVREELMRLGFAVSEAGQSWLGRPGFVDIVVERDGNRSVFAISSGNASPDMVMVHLNRHGDTQALLIRRHLEKKGAQFGYFES